MSAPLTPEAILELVRDQDCSLEYELAHNTVISAMKQYAVQQTAAKDERIKFLEQWADTTEHLINSYKESEKEKDERIKELEERLSTCHKTMERLQGTIEDYGNKETRVAQTLIKMGEELESVKKEKKDLQKRVLLEVNDMVRVMGERDDVIQMLKGYDNVPFEGIARHNWNIKRLETLSRLSSGETKAEYAECPDCVALGKVPNGITLAGEYDECSTCGGTGQIENLNPTNNSSSEKDARIAELEKEVTFLKSIRYESFSLLIPIIEWGQSPEIGLALNSSIAQECLTRAKKSDWYKEQFDLLRESYSTIVPERNQLLEKVEQLEKDIVKYTRQEKELHNIIEEQRSTLVTRYALLKDTQAERDQAFDLLKEVYQKMMSKRAVNRMETHQKVSDFLLSSRANKKQ